ncbi:TrmB family transcriptional regulator [Natronobiforma cellulositropha]|uniref:TrmB family transcriptional regulator n=1 Tax=Natronobiforma cellulositropha TaxID=1679076 RepID=UPI0021D60D0C|nr:TrmB family transcriptional regulator [Natronobiforma cellulositropha]
MDTESLRRALEEAGLTGQQADTYLTLLELGPSPVVEITQRSSVSSSRIYDIVRQLEELGFAETMERDRLYARPREPIDVLERLRSKSEMFADAADEIEDRWEQPDPLESRVSVVKQQETVLRSAGDAIAQAAVSIELALTLEQLEELQPTIETAATENDVVVQVSVYDVEESDLPVPDGVVEVRRNPLPGPFLAIVDRRHAFFSPNVHSDEPYGITIGDEILSFILHWYFLTCLWARLESVHVDPDASPTYISIEEFVHDTVPLWNNGATMTLTTVGQRTDTGEEVEITGQLVGITNDRLLGPEDDPAYTDLAGQLTLFLETDDGVYTVGGWGALLEDVEAQIIRIDSVGLEGAFEW